MSGEGTASRPPTADDRPPTAPVESGRGKPLFQAVRSSGEPPSPGTEAVSAQRSAVGSKARRRSLSDRQIVFLFLTPTLLLLIAMNIFPLIWSLYLSFCDYHADRSQPARWVGSANYNAVLNSPDKWRYFTQTATFVLLAVGIEFVVGFGLALLFQRKFRAQGLMTTLILLPMMLSPVVVGLFWQLIFDPTRGIFNYLLHLGNTVWLQDPHRAMLSLVLIDAWMWSPFVMLIALAGLSAVPEHLYEAAAVDRASGWFKFRHITLPMVAPLLLIALIFRTMDAFKVFDLVWATTEGGPSDITESVSSSLYRIAFQSFNTGQACAMAYIILIVIIALTNLYIRYLARIKGEV
jgi:multiple sugar transport system permease protein